jgi:tartrate dehydrogenase/decarboxylase/D-malate dehydrogenase
MRTTDMNTYGIATIPGDGIGKEVIPPGRQVLEALALSEFSFAFEFENSTGVGIISVSVA